MDLLDNSLLLQIAKYCEISSLNNISKANKQFRDLRLYRLYYGVIFKKRFGLECIRDVKVYKNDNTYHLNHYLKDLIITINSPFSIKPRISKISYEIGYASDWFSTTSNNLEKTKKYWRCNYHMNKPTDMSNKLYRIRLCMTYRISHFRKKLYKKEYGLNLLALIY